MTSSQDVSAEGEPRGLVLHVLTQEPGTEERALRGAFRSAVNAQADLPSGTPLEIVVQGAAVVALAAGSSLAGDVAGLEQAGVRILACSNSLASAGLDAAHLMEGIAVASSAVGQVTRRQWLGWAYVRF